MTHVSSSSYDTCILLLIIHAYLYLNCHCNTAAAFPARILTMLLKTRLQACMASSLQEEEEEKEEDQEVVA